ncbi:MAG TPA: alpha-galactosidase [Ginsengibacter sp.]
MKKLRQILTVCFLIGSSLGAMCQERVETNFARNGNVQVFTLSNSKVTEKVVIADDILQEDELTGSTKWLDEYHNNNHSVITDGNYALEMMWTDWSAPGKIFNGDLQVNFTKNDYKYVSYHFKDTENGGKELELYFTPFNHDNTIQLKLTYQLLADKFYSRRKISLQDTTLAKNWLEAIDSRKGLIGEMQNQSGGYLMKEVNSDTYQQVQTAQTNQKENTLIIKRGEFGQPCAADFSHGGVFFGIEYPTGTNTLQQATGSQLELSCRQLIGEVVRNQWVESNWVVEGLAPDHYVKDWFFNYLPDIRVAPNRPYALYNSWYDLRSPMYPGVKPDHVMNEKNILHIIDLFQKDMIKPYGIHLDAFVLDDGWDVYESDWKMRNTTFPNGVKPIVDALKPLGTTLGLWLGPTGGYSFRMKRINWMKAHGYETVGTTENDAMLDIAGPKYSALFEKRTTDFAKQGVGYFKWDGIQFSSSEPGNGHPVGYFSRRAALESMIAKCKAVRAVNPNEFLNITSGTWMSPWWMQYANQIWMQGADYGFADVPSVNERDGAVTYKDFVLYDDFHNQDTWFPVGNLMTHGIIKGSLESVGGNDDPLDKFTDDAAFYFGRGVTMYELYISPDILNKSEWNALSKSLSWAKDRFNILNKTYMLGGDPTKGAAYGYVHYKGDSGIIAIRNPQMDSQKITVNLDPALGMNADANSLVLERIYPTRWVSPDLFAAGATITLPLQGYEAAVYEVYPLKNASRPLLAGVTYDATEEEPYEFGMHVLNVGNEVKLLNPGAVSSVSIDSKSSDITKLNLPEIHSPEMLKEQQNDFSKNGINSTINLDASTVTARYILFIKPDSSSMGKPFPNMILKVDGRTEQPSVQQQSGSWATYSFVLNNAGRHHLEWQLQPSDKINSWKGTATIWLSGQQEQKGLQVKIKTTNTIHYRPMLPSPYSNNTLKKEFLLGNGSLEL